MGLSGRKVKQRIPKDPRNLSWADDAARFGSNYLSKFGWDSSKGLGAAGDGMTSHIKVSHKLDMLGIGANHQKDPNGIAWKQNRDFENLLRRLNDNLAAEGEAAGNEEEDVEELSDQEKKKKRKHKDSGEEDHHHHKKKKKKEPEVERLDWSTSTTENHEQPGSVTVHALEIKEEVSVDIQRPVVPRHRAHRARAIAAKNIASKSAVHISEILGVVPESSSITTTHSSQAKLTSVTDTDVLGMDKITTSTKSVADYFKDKLLSRSKFTDSASPSPSPDTPNKDESHDTPRMGLGASKFRVDIQTETQIDEETQRIGMSKFSSLMSASFLASASSFSSFVASQVNADEDKDEGSAHISEVVSEPSKEKKKSKQRRTNVEEKAATELGEQDKKKKKEKKEKGKEKFIEEAEGDEAVEEITHKRSKKDCSELCGEKAVKEDAVESRKKEKRESKGDKTEDGTKAKQKEKKKHRTSKEDS